MSLAVRSRPFVSPVSFRPISYRSPVVQSNRRILLASSGVRATPLSLSLAVGDALGGVFEGQDPDWIARRFPTPQALLDAPPGEVLTYTDDTQMAIGVAETLVAHAAIEESRLCQAFVANYVPSRGYGWGARRVLEAME